MICKPDAKRENALLKAVNEGLVTLNELGATSSSAPEMKGLGGEICARNRAKIEIIISGIAAMSAAAHKYS